jgi:hypothetical protein
MTVVETQIWTLPQDIPKNQIVLALDSRGFSAEGGGFTCEFLQARCPKI